MNTFFYRIGAYLKHFFSARNTTGEGIHSPYLFELVRFVLRDRNAYYCFSDIERKREQLIACADELDVVDYGSAGSPEGLHVRRKVCDIAHNHLESPRVGQALFRILNWMGHHQQPLEILELGTSLGITTSYLASASSANHVVSLEGSSSVAAIAQGVWRNLGLTNIECHLGNIDDTLYIYAREQLDMAYIDANHTYEATMRYGLYLIPRMRIKGVLVLDDIHYSPAMERAWNELKCHPRVTTSMDLYDIGILFFDPHYLKRHYTLRL